MATLEEILAPYINNQSNIGKLNQAYQLLGQPGTETGELATRRGNLAAGGTENLARAFVQEYQSRYGKMPTDQEVSQFVSTSFTPEYAKNLALQGTSDISGALPVVSPYLQNQAQTNQYADISKGLGSFDPNAYMQNLKDIFGSQQQLATGAINDIFNKQKIGAVEDAAALGTLRSPAGYVNISNIESARGRSLSDAIANLLGIQGSEMNKGLQFGANYGLERGKTLADVLGQQQTQGLAQSKFDYAKTAQDRQDALDEIFRNASLAESIRRNRTENSEDIFSKINKGIGVAQGITNLGSSLYGKGQKGGLFA